jgi:carbon storage regulator CsrA
MLVLSRRVNEKILFPGINTAVRVVSCKRGVVRLGIEAPPEVTVLREELRQRPASAGGAVNTAPGDPAPRERQRAALLRQVRDRLQVTGVGLGAVQLLLDAGLTEDGKDTLARIRDDLQLLRFGLDGELEDPPPQRPPAKRKAPTALLVEDDGNQRELLAGFLRLAGLEVDTAGDGSDALDYLRSRPRPDVVLMDMGLPRCDGPTAVRQIRRDPTYAGLRIFAVTGGAPEQFDLGSGPAGVDRWFCKPLDPASLLNELKQELGAFPCAL